MLDQLRQRNRITSFGQEFFHFELRSVHICMPCQSKICEICKTCKPSYQLLLRPSNPITAFGQEHFWLHLEVKLDWQHPMLELLRQPNRIIAFGQEFFHFELRSVHICMPCQSKICEI